MNTLNSQYIFLAIGQKLKTLSGFGQACPPTQSCTDLYPGITTCFQSHTFSSVIVVLIFGKTI